MLQIRKKIYSSAVYLASAYLPKLFSILTVSMAIKTLSPSQFSDFDYLIVTGLLLSTLLSMGTVDAFYHFGKKESSDIESPLVFLVITHVSVYLVSCIFADVNVEFLSLLFLLSLLNATIYTFKIMSRLGDKYSWYFFGEFFHVMIIYLLVLGFQRQFELTSLSFIYIYVLSMLASVMIYGLKFRQELKAKVDPKSLKKMIRYGVLILPGPIFVQLFFNIFRYFPIFGENDFYSLNYRLLALGFILNSALILIWQDLYYEKKVRKMKYFLASLVVSIIMVSFLSFSIKYFGFLYFGDRNVEFTPYVLLLDGIILVFYFMSSSISIPLNYHGKPWVNTLSAIIGFSLLSLLGLLSMYFAQNLVLSMSVAFFGILSVRLTGFVWLKSVKEVE